MSHKGTKFKPITFRLAEKVDKILLCGCKLSSKVPFCDGVTCMNLKQNEMSKLFYYIFIIIIKNR